MPKYPKCKNPTCKFCTASWQWKDQIIATQASAAHWYEEARLRLQMELNADLTDHSWSNDAQRIAQRTSMDVRRYLGIED